MASMHTLINLRFPRSELTNSIQQNWQKGPFFPFFCLFAHLREEGGQKGQRKKKGQKENKTKNFLATDSAGALLMVDEERTEW
ncbi:hypothetical protein CEXT_235411 [Caerostris extrusa]|uniref:Uncharacterized protein n=1 Tax=Caerostris extrusa TaxID=172846 RepID=A0AAV4X595_CAEEX|nr:hypothetical protein CEXT_235411 [Caerostris extrusa]